MVCLSFPRGLLHGWYFSRDSLHIQAVSESYADYNKDDNWGCYWADPDVGIPWPMLSDRVILADRARKFPRLKTLIRELSAA